MKRLIKNKILVLIICVIIVSLSYIGIQKAINSYTFSNNNEIITDDESSNQSLEHNTMIVSEEETEFITEEVESSSEDELIQDDDISEEAESNSNNSNRDKTDNGQSQIYVYITGEVNNPGVVILNEGSRILDAINAAGGTTVNANISKVNLVYILDDGMKVNIPNDSDLKNNSDFEYITMNSGDGGKDNYLQNKGSSSFADESSKGESSNSGSNRKYSVVNINTATQTELETLPGIGPSLALKIINYRKENGKFSSIEEIKNVSGIGESKFENLKGYITVRVSYNKKNTINRNSHCILFISEYICRY